MVLSKCLVIHFTDIWKRLLKLYIQNLDCISETIALGGVDNRSQNDNLHGHYNVEGCKKRNEATWNPNYRWFFSALVKKVICTVKHFTIHMHLILIVCSIGTTFSDGSLWSAWQSSSDRRMLTKSMKLILWRLISLNNCLTISMWRKTNL